MDFVDACAVDVNTVHECCRVFREGGVRLMCVVNVRCVRSVVFICSKGDIKPHSKEAMLQRGVFLSACPQLRIVWVCVLPVLYYKHR